MCSQIEKAILIICYFIIIYIDLTSYIVVRYWPMLIWCVFIYPHIWSQDESPERYTCMKLVDTPVLYALSLDGLLLLYMFLYISPANQVWKWMYRSHSCRSDVSWSVCLFVERNTSTLLICLQ